MREFSKSILGGFIISIAAFCYASTNGSYIGALLFSFGLITILMYEFNLFTGTIGFVQNEFEIEDAAIILLGNVIGCIFAASFLTMCSTADVSLFIHDAMNCRIIHKPIDVLRALYKAMFCGFIMTTVVKFGKQYKENGFASMLPLLLGVPLFLICGFYHCIVDAFYFSYGIMKGIGNIDCFDEFMVAITSWFIIVIGNIIGCNLVRILTWNKNA